MEHLRSLCLQDELDITLKVAMVMLLGAGGGVVISAEAVGKDPHFHGAVGAAGEDVIGRLHLHLHDARAQVAEERLPSVFVGEAVEQTLRGQVPHLK